MKSVKIVNVLCILMCIAGFGIESKELPAEASMTTPELAILGGYPVEEHVVRTSDDYILKMYRIPGGRNGKKFNPYFPPVVLVHGMMTSSRDFLLMGPDKSLGFILADAGYDVWMPNMRFNQYASHATRARSDPSYWDFDMDEHGGIDIAESMDKVLQTTKANKVHYIGYSMGANVYIIMCNRRPDLATRMASFLATAPAIYMTTMKPLAELFDRLSIPNFLRNNGIHAIVLDNNLRKYLVGRFCSPSKPAEDICFALFFLFVGEDYEQVDWEKSPAIFNRFQPIGVKQMEHFVQLVKTDTLSKFDYGKEENLKRYGTEAAPRYSMTANLAPVVIYYSENDRLISLNDTKKLANIYQRTNTLMSVRKIAWRKFNHVDYIYAKDGIFRLKNELEKNGQTVKLHKVKWKKFNHVDFATAKDIGILLNKEILTKITKLSKQCVE